MIEFVIKDRDDPMYSKNCKTIPTRRVRRQGHTYEINGQRVELFTIGVMAEAMDRDVECVLRWEKMGLFPKPLFHVTGGRKSRLYSAIQVVNCHRIAWYRYKFCKGRYFDVAKFCADIREIFYADRLAVKTTGETVLKRKEEKPLAKTSTPE